MPTEAQLIAKERMALMKLMDEAGGEYAVPKRMVDENILIATWNLQQFGARHSDRAIQYIADIVERFDIVALQEVKTDLTSLKKLIGLLPGNYDFLVSDPTGNNERFAFLYDKRTVRPTGLVAEVAFNVPAKSHTGYQLHRTPYCASFKAGRFDFVVVNVHIYYGDNKDGKNHREKEIELLADHLKKSSKRAGKATVFDPDYFVAGDFNIETMGDRFFNALVRNGFTMPKNMGELKTNFTQTSTFDKIAWVDRDSFKFSGECNVVPYHKAVYQDLPKKEARKEISDHLPLWAEFRVNELTQQLNSIIQKEN